MQDELTIVEQTELDQHESVIERGFKTFVEVGQALATIRDKRLYRAKFATFEDYCTIRWKFTRQRAYQLLSASAVAIGLSTTVDIPNEAIARQFARLENPEHRRAAAMMAVATAPDGKITASWVASTIDMMQEVEGTGGFADIGRRYAAFDAAITHEEHQKMIHEKEQIAAPKQKPLAVIELPAAALAGIAQLAEQLSNVDDAEMLRLVIYKVQP